MGHFQFGVDEEELKSIIHDPHKFNKKILRQKYHHYAKGCHPDKVGSENNNEWLKLCSYYGVLLAICEERDKLMNISADEGEHDDEEQRSLISNRLIIDKY